MGTNSGWSGLGAADPLLVDTSGPQRRVQARAAPAPAPGRQAAGGSLGLRRGQRGERLGAARARRTLPARGLHLRGAAPPRPRRRAGWAAGGRHGPLRAARAVRRPPAGAAACRVRARLCAARGVERYRRGRRRRRKRKCLWQPRARRAQLVVQPAVRARARRRRRGGGGRGLGHLHGGAATRWRRVGRAHLRVSFCPTAPHRTFVSI
ncbi:hypothetical protein T492DRAFT_402435 [Pavlovales sp. CCMP2436]|nr:hypothetical protein T492DRAFT_402435 [Pavlovales sp. CCMP2436]